MMSSGIAKEEYLVVFLRSFSPVLHINISYGYSLEMSRNDASDEYPQPIILCGVGGWGVGVSPSFHQMLSLNKTSKE